MRKKAGVGGKERKGGDKIIQGHNQNSLVNRPWVTVEGEIFRRCVLKERERERCEGRNVNIDR